MMSPQQAFCYYYGLHLHFNKDDYSILKYGPNTKQAIAMFYRLPQNVKYRFDFLSKQFTSTQDLVYACIGSEFNGFDVKFANKSDITESYFEYKSRRESISYVLTNEYEKYLAKNEFKFHQLLFNYFAKQYSPEFVLLMDDESNNLNKVLDSDVFLFGRNKILKLIKYKSFFSVSKYKSIITPAQHEESAVSE